MTLKYHANVTQACLQIFIAYPEDLYLRISNREAAANAALVGFPEYHASLAKALDHPEYTAFAESLSWEEIRSEFQRKAKKLGYDLPTGFGVSFNLEPRGILATVRVRKNWHNPNKGPDQ